MTRGIVGAIIGLIIGWAAGAILQRAIDWVGVDSLVVIPVVILGAVLGAGVEGLVGALVRAIAGAIPGALGVKLFLSFLRLVTMVVGAVLGWRWAIASDRPLQGTRRPWQASYGASGFLDKRGK